MATARDGGGDPVHEESGGIGAGFGGTGSGTTGEGHAAGTGSVAARTYTTPTDPAGVDSGRLDRLLDQVLGPDGAGASLGTHGRGRQYLFATLDRVQAAFGWLPTEAQARVARRLGIPRYQVGSVVTFYPHFRTAPPAPVEVAVCCDMACHLRGAGAVLGAAQALADKEIRVGTVSCLGRCDRPTAVVVNGRILPGVAPDDLPRLVAEARAGGNGHAHASTEPPLRDGLIYRCDPYGRRGEYRAARALIEGRGGDEVVALLDASGLRGMGGAGFPTGRKWGLVRATQADTKWVVCNADESEPGTIKDRQILEQLPELVIEGLLCGGLTVGARRGIIYLRHEYESAAAALRAELVRCRSLGLLGTNLLGSGRDFDIELFISPGGYICGEETALLEALEGKRAEPRNKPPFPGTWGLHGQPTLINSVETFAFVPAILLNGPDWWRAQGVNGATGLKFFALSGHVARPGVYEAPLGLPAAQLIAEAGGGVLGGALKAFAPGGASSNFLPSALADTPLDFDAVRRAGSMLGTGAVVAVAEGTCMLDLALNVARFFRNESCGKCVPCGVGTQKLVDLLERIAAGSGTLADLDLIRELSEAMMAGSICGLGQAAPNPVLSVLAHFGAEVTAHLTERRCPSGVCPVSGGGAA